MNTYSGDYDTILPSIHWVDKTCHICYYHFMQVFFPLQSQTSIPREETDSSVPTHKLQRMVSTDKSNQMFAALMWKNENDKTPLHLAIENNHIW